MERYYKLDKLCENIIDPLNWDKTHKLINTVNEKFDYPEWDDVINRLYYNYKYIKGKWRFGITKNAIILSEKIEKKLNIRLFPMIIPEMSFRGHKDAGCWLWNMYDCNMNVYGSCDKVSDCLKKKNELIWHNNNEIMIK